MRPRDVASAPSTSRALVLPPRNFHLERLVTHHLTSVAAPTGRYTTVAPPLHHRYTAGDSPPPLRCCLHGPATAPAVAAVVEALHGGALTQRRQRLRVEECRTFSRVVTGRRPAWPHFDNDNGRWMPGERCVVRQAVRRTARDGIGGRRMLSVAHSVTASVVLDV